MQEVGSSVCVLRAFVVNLVHFLLVAFLCPRHNTRLKMPRINPRWMTGGDLARKYAGRNAASAQRLARRARICAMGYSDIPRQIRQAVRAFAAGELFPPEKLTTISKSRISNWASLKSTPVNFPWGLDIAGDWFFEDANLKDGIVAVDQVPS